MTRKPHRLIRTSRRVSSETGVAIDAMTGEPGPTRYGLAKSFILNILSQLPPAERRTMLADVAREITKEVGQP